MAQTGWESRNTKPYREVNGQIVLTWIPSRREWSVSIAGRRESFPLSVSQSSTTNPQPGRQKGKGRVCLGEEGDSKEEEKGKEEIRGVACIQHWSDGRWEELESPIAYGGGREYAEELKSQELTEGYSLSGAKGFGFLRCHPVPIKGQRMQLITFKL